MTEPAEPVAVRGRIGRLSVLFAAHAAGSANITLVLAKAPAIEQALGLGHAGFGLMVSAYYGALLVLSVPGGWLVDRFGIRAMLAAAHALIAGGMAIIAQAAGPLTAGAGLVLCGAGYALINPATARGVLIWFPLRGRATAMGMKQTGVPAGGILAAAIAAAVAADWRVLVAASAGITLVAGGGSFALRAIGPTTGPRMRLTDIRAAILKPRLIVLNGASCLYAVAQSAFFAYLVLFVRDSLAAPAALAGSCLAVAHAASAAGRIGLGVASDVLARGRRLVILYICGFSGGVGMVVLALTPAAGEVAPLLGISAVLGATLGGYAGLTQAAVVEAVEPRLAGASIGNNMMLTNGGMMLGPALFGAGVEWAGYAPAWLAVAAVLAVGAGLFAAAARSAPAR